MDGGWLVTLRLSMFARQRPSDARQIAPCRHALLSLSLSLSLSVCLSVSLSLSRVSRQATALIAPHPPHAGHRGVFGTIPLSSEYGTYETVKARPNSGLGVKVKVIETFRVFPLRLEADPAQQSSFVGADLAGHKEDSQGQILALARAIFQAKPFKTF